MKQKHFYTLQVIILAAAAYLLATGYTIFSSAVLVLSLAGYFFYNRSILKKINSLAARINEKESNKNPLSILDSVDFKLLNLEREADDVSLSIEKIGNQEDVIEFHGRAGKALSSLNQKLLTLKKEEHLRMWAVKGQAMLAEIRNNESDLTTYSYEILSKLINYVNANQGVFYIHTELEGKSHLKLLSSYAYGKRKYSEREIIIESGEGLLGECVLSKDIIFMKSIPKNYVRITSGLGDATPSCIIILPLMFKGNVLGAIEMASLKVFANHEVEFLKKVSESIGSELFTIKNHESTRVLLEQAQVMSTELRSQEEEMRHNMDEMERKQAELNGVLDSIDRAMGACEFSLTGTPMHINSNLLKYLGLSEAEMKSKDLDWFCGDQQRFIKVEDAIKKGQSYSDEYALALGTKVIWLNVSFNPVKNGSGEIVKILMLAQDVTIKKEKEKEFETLSLVADNTDNSVLITDSNGKIIYTNSGFTRMTGYSLQECLGKKPGSFLQGPETDKETVNRIGQKLKTGESIYEEILNYHKDGHSYWISMSISPIKDEQGNIEKFISIQANITDTKQQALDFHYKLDSISKTNAMIEFDSKGNIQYINDFFLRVTDFKMSDLHGKPYTALIPESEITKPQTQILWENLFAGQSFTGEFKYIDSHGKEQWLAGTYNPIVNVHGKLEKIMMLGQFVTEDREKHQELKQYVNILKQAFPLFEVNNQLQLKSCNDKFLTLTSLKRMEFNRKKIEEILTSDSVDDLASIVQSNSEKSLFSLNLSVRNGIVPHTYSTAVSLVKDQSNKLVRAIVILKEEDLLSA